MRGPRFGVPLTDEAAALNASVGFDWRLLPHDINGSKAHARMLASRGIISQPDADAICAGLDGVFEEWQRGELVLEPALEDIHMNVERRLADRIGDAAGRLHTARSRNDQVATDLRLYAREAAVRIGAALVELRRSLVRQARAHLDTVMPGYTHLQRAQPTRLAHHLLAYDAMFARDGERLTDGLRRTNRSPLGSGALTGTSFPIDRQATATALGFHGLAINTMDAVGDRDFAVELVSSCALAMVHLSRLGEELVLWASSEFGYVRLPEGYCAGSSIMPQKVNPDVPELVRGKVGRVIGDLVNLLTVIKGLPLAYNKDLQETQEPLYDAVETLEACARVMAGCIAGCTFNVERMRIAVGESHLTATELADHLAARGMPFRNAHAVVGALVRRATERRVNLDALSLAEMREVAPEIDDDALAALDATRAVDRRDVPGGPARNRLIAELDRLERELG